MIVEEDRFVVVVERWDLPVVVGHSKSNALSCCQVVVSS
jgi:hypothetical protein